MIMTRHQGLDHARVTWLCLGSVVMLCCGHVMLVSGHFMIMVSHGGAMLCSGCGHVVVVMCCGPVMVVS